VLRSFVLPRYHWAGLVAATLSWSSAYPTTTAGAGAQLVEYRDPGRRFTFAYPQSFGTPSVGTDNGFGNRVAAIRFAVFSTQGIGGEAVLSQGPPTVDVFAVGGLYDAIGSGALPTPIRNAVTKVLPVLTPASFCNELARDRHIDIKSPVFASLTPDQRSALDALDLMGNSAPRAIARCTVSGDTVLFDKAAAVIEGGPPRRVYGGVRFLSGRYSTFQLVRAAGSADAALLEEIGRVLASLRLL